MTPSNVVFWSLKSRYIGYDDVFSPRVEPNIGPFSFSCTMRSGSRIGSIRSRIWSMRLKMAVFAPIPSAKESTATVVKTGLLVRLRTAKRSEDISTRSARDGPQRQLAYFQRLTQPSTRSLVPEVGRDVVLNGHYFVRVRATWSITRRTGPASRLLLFTRI